MLRYGEKNNLTVAVPKFGHTLYSQDWDLVGAEHNVSYNIFCLHTRSGTSFHQQLKSNLHFFKSDSFHTPFHNA